MKSNILRVLSNDRITDFLKREYAGYSISVSLKERLGIVLDGIAGMSNYESTRGRGISESTGLKWRHRWNESFERIEAIQEFGTKAEGEPATDSELRKAIREVLGDLPRSGKPNKFTMSQMNQIVAMASQKPEDHGIPMSQWTYAMLAHVARAEGIVDYISATHVGNILKKTN